MAIHRSFFPSPVSNLEIRSSEDHICAVLFPRGELPGAPAIINVEGENKHPLIRECEKQLTEYFAGRRTLFDLPLTREGSAFEQQVWAALLNIPYGRTISYLDLSKRIGNVKAIRAVGTTNGRNSISIIVPCHRVIGSDGSLTGYGGGLWRKKWLLDHEAKFAHGVQTLF